jgi:hypothetical protein
MLERYLTGLVGLAVLAAAWGMVLWAVRRHREYGRVAAHEDSLAQGGCGAICAVCDRTCAAKDETENEPPGDDHATR